MVRVAERCIEGDGAIVPLPRLSELPSAVRQKREIRHPLDQLGVDHERAVVLLFRLLKPPKTAQKGPIPLVRPVIPRIELHSAL